MHSYRYRAVQEVLCVTTRVRNYNGNKNKIKNNYQPKLNLNLILK